MPKVSVIIPTYNSSQYLGEALISVLNQTYQDFEIIVIDDGSTDNTKQIIDSYKEEIKYFYQDHSGVAEARNLGIKVSTGEYVAFLDADDISRVNRLEIQNYILNMHSDIDLVFSQTAFFDTSSKSFGSFWGGIPLEILNSFKSTFLYLFFNGHSIPTPTVMFRRKILEGGIYFDTSFPIGEDYFFYLSISLNHRLFCYQEPLAYVRQGQSNHLTSNAALTQLTEKRVLKSAYTKYKAELNITTSDFNKAISNSYLRDYLKYSKLRKHFAAINNLVRAIAICPLNIRIYKTLILNRSIKIIN